LKLINGQGNGIFMLDREMRQRVFVDSTQAAVKHSISKNICKKAAFLGGLFCWK